MWQFKSSSQMWCQQLWHAGNLNVAAQMSTNQGRRGFCNNYVKMRGNNLKKLVSFLSLDIPPFNSFALQLK